VVRQSRATAASAPRASSCLPRRDDLVAPSRFFSVDSLGSLPPAASISRSGLAADLSSQTAEPLTQSVVCCRKLFRQKMARIGTCHTSHGCEPVPILNRRLPQTLLRGSQPVLRQISRRDRRQVRHSLQHCMEEAGIGEVLASLCDPTQVAPIYAPAPVVFGSDGVSFRASSPAGPWSSREARRHGREPA